MDSSNQTPNNIDETRQISTQTDKESQFNRCEISQTEKFYTVQYTQTEQNICSNFSQTVSVLNAETSSQTCENIPIS